MNFEIVSDRDRAYEFVTRFYPYNRTEWQKGICLLRDGEVVCGVIYDEFNGTNVFMHVAAEVGGKWLTRDFLRCAFHYPFVQLGVKRITGWVEAHNFKARRFDEHLGFKEEARLKGAGTNGVDVILYVMRREDCRYV